MMTAPQVKLEYPLEEAPTQKYNMQNCQDEFLSMGSVIATKSWRKVLQSAIDRRDAATVRDLIFHDANISNWKGKNYSVLHRICALEDLELLHALLRRPTIKEIATYQLQQIINCITMQKSCLEALNSGETPLLFAVRHDNIKLAENLLKYGANVNSKNSKCGCTPLHVAVMKDSLQMVQLLLKWKPDVNARSYADRSVLDMADSGEYAIIWELTKAGAVCHQCEINDLFWSADDTESEYEEENNNFNYSCYYKLTAHG